MATVTAWHSGSAQAGTESDGPGALRLTASGPALRKMEPTKFKLELQVEWSRVRRAASGRPRATASVVGRRKTYNRDTVTVAPETRHKETKQLTFATKTVDDTACTFASTGLEDSHCCSGESRG